MSEPVTIKEAINQFTETNHPQLLAVREEINALVNADSDEVFQVARDRLGQIHAEAEARGDSQTMALAVDCYTQIETLYQANDQLFGVAVASKAAMDKAIDERDDLVDAIEEHDRRHPLVGRMIADLRDQFDYENEAAMYDHLYDMLLENAVENIAHMMDIADDEMNNMLAMIVCYGYDGYGDAPIDQEDLFAIGKFIAERLSKYKVVDEEAANV